MSTEAAKVVIDAEDLASKKVEAAARAVEKNIKGIKEVGGKAKASTEFIGTLANTLGGTAFGSYAGQLAQLTERISAFSEVSKAGGAGAFAFKAGLAGVVAVLSFKVGEAIGNVVFQTKMLTREFERAKEAAGELNQELLKSNQKAFENTLEDIDLIRDIEGKRKAQEEFFSILEKNVEGATAQLKESQKAADALVDAMVVVNRVKWVEKAEQEVAINKERLRQAKEMRDALREELSERTRINNEIRSANEAAAKAEAEAIRAVEDANKAREAAEQKTMDTLARAVQKNIDDAQRLEDIKQNEINRLKEQRIELEKGSEAAHAFRLEQQGLDEATAKRLAAEQSAIDRLRESKEGKDDVFGSQQIGTTAVQSRLLTRGPAEKGIDKIAKNTEKTVDWLQKLNDVVEKNNRTAALELEFVS